MNEFLMSNQIVLTSLSKAGGVGKTTTAVNLAYEWSLRGYSVGIIDLDLNHSIEEFVGLSPKSDRALTSLGMFDPDFSGDYGFEPIFGSDKIAVLQGHPEIENLAESLYSRRKRESILSKILSKYPLNFDLIIFDLPGGFDLITENVLSVCTHILIPVHIGVKTLSVANLIESIYKTVDELELDPEPEILGLIPNKYDTSSSTHETVYAGLQDIAQQLNYKLYPPIRYWRSFERAAIQGKSLKQLKSTDLMSQIFSQVVDDLVKEFN